MGTLLELKDAGKIRAIGVSNVTTQDMDQYSQYGPLDADQEKYNLTKRDAEKENIPWYVDHGTTFIVYSAITQGHLTGTIDPDKTYDKNNIRSMNPFYEKDKLLQINQMLKDQFEPITQTYDCSLSQLGIASAIAQKNEVTLCGAYSLMEAVEKLKEAADSLSD